MTLWLTLFAATCILYAVLALLAARSGRSPAEPLLALSVPSAAILLRGAFGDASMLGAVRGATLLPLLILVVSGGRPGRIFDQRIKARTLRRMSKSERQAYEREDFKSGISQLALVACIIVGVIIYVVEDWTFLD